jgi:AcrR family transcriptional regulator
MPVPKKGGSPRERSQRGRRKQADVLAGVNRVIAARGVEDTRFSDVMAETGAALSTLQYRFGSWEGMILAALREANRLELAGVEEALAGATDTVDALRRCVLQVMSAGESRPQARASWLTWMESWRAAARDEELAAEWRAVHEQWRQVFVPILTRGEQEGVFTLPGGAVAASVQVLGLMDGLGVPVVLGTEDMTPEHAGELALQGTALLVGCPQLVERAAE